MKAFDDFFRGLDALLSKLMSDVKFDIPEGAEQKVTETVEEVRHPSGFVTTTTTRTTISYSAKGEDQVTLDNKEESPCSSPSA